jgi:hypothetical protein
MQRSLLTPEALIRITSSGLDTWVSQASSESSSSKLAKLMWRPYKRLNPLFYAHPCYLEVRCENTFPLNWRQTASYTVENKVPRGIEALVFGHLTSE